MAGCSINVLSFSFKCDYYSSGFSSDFDIVPLDETKNIFKRYNIKLIKSESKYTICWLTKNIEDVSKCFKKIFSDINIEFYIYVKNKNIYNYCDLDINTCYNYTNLKDNQDLCVNKTSNSDSKIHQNKLFGILKLDSNLFKYGIETNYFINIPVIKSYWEISINSNSEYRVVGVNINEKNYKFIKSSNNDDIYISENPIELREKYEMNTFATVKINRKNIEVLFIPPKSFYKKNGNKYISCAEIYI